MSRGEMAPEKAPHRKTVFISVVSIAGVFLVSMFASAVTSSEWNKVNLDRAWQASRSVAMALDEDDHPNVAYLAYDPQEGPVYFASDLIYAHISGTSIERVKLADLSTDTCEMAIVIDRQGGVHVFAGLFHEESIVYANNMNGQWETSTMPLEGYCSSIKAAIDHEDRLHIMYVEWVGYQDSLGNDFFRQCLRLLTIDIAGNHTKTITETEVNGGWLTITAFGFDSQGFMHLMYIYMNYSGPSGGYLFYSWLYYLTNKDGTWSNHTFINGTTVSPGRPSLVLDSQDRVHVCYYRPSGEDLEICYANNVGGSWEEESLGTAGDTGSPSSIALDRYGGVHVLYYATYLEKEDPYSISQEGTLMYVSYRDGATDHFTIQKHQWGFFNSADIAVDAEGVVHIFYNYYIRIPPNPLNPEGSSESFIRYASNEEGPLVSNADLRNAAIITTGSCVAGFLAVLACVALKSRRAGNPKS